MYGKIVVAIGYTVWYNGSGALIMIKLPNKADFVAKTMLVALFVGGLIVALLCSCKLLVGELQSARSTVAQAKTDQEISTAKTMAQKRELSGSRVWTYIDEETGVHYLVFIGSAGVQAATPQYNADGGIITEAV